MAPTHPSLPVKKYELNFQREPILISRLSGQQELRLKLKQNEAVSGHKGYHRGTPQLKDADIKLCECFEKYIIDPQSKRVWTNISLDMGSFFYQVELKLYLGNKKEDKIAFEELSGRTC